MAVSVFGAWDYAIMAATMIASLAIGVYFRFSGGKQKTNEVTHFLYIYYYHGFTVTAVSCSP